MGSSGKDSILAAHEDILKLVIIAMNDLSGAVSLAKELSNIPDFRGTYKKMEEMQFRLQAIADCERKVMEKMQYLLQRN